jgi:hypothetical protein
MSTAHDTADTLAHRLDIWAGDARALLLDIDRLGDAHHDRWVAVMRDRVKGLLAIADAAAAAAGELATRLEKL